MGLLGIGNSTTNKETTTKNINKTKNIDNSKTTRKSQTNTVSDKGDLDARQGSSVQKVQGISDSTLKMTDHGAVDRALDASTQVTESVLDTVQQSQDQVLGTVSNMGQAAMTKLDNAQERATKVAQAAAESETQQLVRQGAMVAGIGALAWAAAKVWG
jgi:hypothetical protein